MGVENVQLELNFHFYICLYGAILHQGFLRTAQFFISGFLYEQKAIHAVITTTF